MDNYILKVQHIIKEFPGVKALYNVSLDLLQGEVHALVGENGAGKSTLIKILTGAYKMDSGKIIFDGSHIDFNNPKEALDQGISAVYQELSLIPHFSVTENMFLGKEKIKKITKLINWSAMKKRTQEVLDQYGIKVDADSLVKDLPIGQRQMVEIVIRVFWKTKLIIMDEPTTSLDENEVDKLFSMIKCLKSDGVTVLYISHRLDEIFHIADNVTILKNGEKVGTYNIKNLDKNFIIKKMTGREIGRQFYKIKIPRQNIELLSVSEFEKKDYFNDINFKVDRGEIVGFYGLVGSGRSEVMMALIGAFRKDKGTIKIRGKKVLINNVKDAINLGIGLIPEDRKIQGLVLNLPVFFNLSLSILDFLTNKIGFIKNSLEIQKVLQIINSLKIKTPSHLQKVKLLSGGNQQKVVVAKWLLANSEIIIMDEPTKGIDVGAKEEIYHLISSLVKEGKGIIIISSELPEIIGLSDRVYVMKAGRISGELSSEELDEEKILHLSVI